MSAQGDELEEIKTLGRHHLASIVWALRAPRDNASYVKEIAQHIQIKFNEPSSSKYAQEINEFSNLRNIALSTLSETAIRDANSLKTLKQYYCQLAAMLTRFKDCGATFTWRDSYGRHSTEGGLEFEMNNIMYNIAAIHNGLGAKTPRSSESSTREVCAHFSNALWWVTELRDNRAGVKPKELGHDQLTFYHHVLKAQAQECILSHSLQSGMKPENVAKIAVQIYMDYNVASKLFLTPLYTDPIKIIMNDTPIFDIWKSTIEFKCDYFEALMLLLVGLSYRDDDPKEIGLRIARLKHALRIIERRRKCLSNTVDDPVYKQAFNALDSLITKKLDKAVRYNDNVYHSSIPGYESLPQITGKFLASPVPFNVNSIPNFCDLFSNLVTIEAVQVNSIYSQKKDDLSRQIKTQVSKQDEELAHMMSTVNLDKRSLRMPAFETPDELIEMCAELSMNPNIVDDVLTKLEDLDDKSEEIQKLLDEVSNILRKRPNRELDSELKRFQQTHQDALRTTQSLHKQLYPDLQKKIQMMATADDPLSLLPKLPKMSADDEAIVRKLERLMDRIDDMKCERADLLTQLSKSLEDDDVIRQVVAASNEQELKNVFDSEIQKHHKFLDPLMNNLKLQNELLDELERANAQYGQVKLNYRAMKAACTEAIESMRKFYTQFKTLDAGIDQGLEYHNKMVDLVRKFYSKVKASNDLNDLLN